MSIRTRRERERAEREQLIVTAARELAEAEGWEAVTTRRLAAEIEYGRPVLYSHFKDKDAIMAAVAVEGRAEPAAELRAARSEAGRGGARRGGARRGGARRGGARRGGARRGGARRGGARRGGARRGGARRGGGRAGLAAVGEAYTAFARRRPALYDAMFTHTVPLPFATAEAPAALWDAFDELAAAVAPVAAPDDDSGLLTETYWASLHGLVTLMRSGRLPEPAHAQRLELLTGHFAAGVR